MNHQKFLSNKSLFKLLTILCLILIVGIFTIELYDQKFLIIIFFACCSLINLTISHLNYKHIFRIKDDYNQLTSYIQLNKRINADTILPLTRGYAGSPDFLNFILDKIEEINPRLIVEASCGVSSIVISDYLQKSNSECKHIALEHDELYRKKCQRKITNTNSTIHHTPLKKYIINKNEWIWYDISKVSFSGKIDLLIIDGPPAYLQKNSRFPALPLLGPFLSKECVIVMDDFNRTQEQRIINIWKRKYNLRVETIQTEKGTGLLTLKNSSNYFDVSI